MSVKRILTAVITGCAAVIVSTAAPGLAAQASAKPQQVGTDQMKTADMAAKCQAMMAEHEKMMTDMKVADQRLDDLVVKMNAASGMEKTAATASVVTEMVTQSRTMRDGMMKMQQDMMVHMMEHMQAGKDSMAMCPMMKHMGDKKH
jgi:hypothetical protein